MDPVGDRFAELAKIQQEAYQSASLQSELFTLQKMVMHLQGEINRVQEKIDQSNIECYLYFVKNIIYFLY